MRSAAVSRPLSPVPRAPAVIEPILGRRLRRIGPPFKRNGRARGPARRLGGSGLRQEIRHGDTSAGSSQRADRGVRTERLHGPIAPATTRVVQPAGLSVDLENPVHEVDDPVLRNSGSSEGAALARPIEAQTGQRDLDHQRGAGGVSVAVVARRAADHADIGLGLRPRIERQWAPEDAHPTRPRTPPAAPPARGEWQSCGRCSEAPSPAEGRRAAQASRRVGRRWHRPGQCPQGYATGPAGSGIIANHNENLLLPPHAVPVPPAGLREAVPVSLG
jgi:hypothetical protein